MELKWFCRQTPFSSDTSGVTTPTRMGETTEVYKTDSPKLQVDCYGRCHVAGTTRKWGAEGDGSDVIGKGFSNQITDRLIRKNKKHHRPLDSERKYMLCYVLFSVKYSIRQNFVFFFVFAFFFKSFSVFLFLKKNWKYLVLWPGTFKFKSSQTNYTAKQ